MINFIGAVAASFIFGIIIGSRIRRLSFVVYVILFIVALAVSFFVGDYPFYGFTFGSETIPVNTVFITSFLGLIFGSALLGGGRP